eukprot:2260177-Prymnesium_polylepis.1
MQQLDVPNERAERNEANAETQRLARGSDNPRVPPAPAPALEHLFAPKPSRPSTSLRQQHAWRCKRIRRTAAHVPRRQNH